jgi:hypothetical protein
MGCCYFESRAESPHEVISPFAGLVGDAIL